MKQVVNFAVQIPGTFFNVRSGIFLKATAHTLCWYHDSGVSIGADMPVLRFLWVHKVLFRLEIDAGMIFDASMILDTSMIFETRMIFDAQNMQIDACMIFDACILF